MLKYISIFLLMISCGPSNVDSSSSISTTIEARMMCCGTKAKSKDIQLEEDNKDSSPLSLLGKESLIFVSEKGNTLLAKLRSEDTFDLVGGHKEKISIYSCCDIEDEKITEDKISLRSLQNNNFTLRKNRDKNPQEVFKLVSTIEWIGENKFGKQKVKFDFYDHKSQKYQSVIREFNFSRRGPWEFKVTSLVGKIEYKYAYEFRIG